MASENLVKELWEIIQKENSEEISYNDFESDLNKAFKLPKDELDRAINLMISQAEVNPNIVGEYKGGSFMISSSFTNTVVSTIKYENQFIPGKAEYEARLVGENVKSDIAIGALILTPSLLDRMIENYGELSDGDIEKLWDEYPDMDSNQKRALREAREKKLESIVQDEQTPEEVKEMAADMKSHSEIRGDVSDAMDDKSDTGYFIARETFKALRESDPEKFSTNFPNLVNVNLDEVSDDVIKYEWARYEKLSAKVEDRTLDEKKQQIVSAARETFKNLVLVRPDLVKKYFPMLNNQDLETVSEDVILKALTILKELQNNRDKETSAEISLDSSDGFFGTGPIIEDIDGFQTFYQNESTGKYNPYENYDQSTYAWLTDNFDKVLRRDNVKVQMMQELVENASLHFESTQRMQEVMQYISKYLPQCDVVIDLSTPSQVVGKLIRTIPDEFEVKTEELQAIFMGQHGKSLVGMLKSDPKGMSHMFEEPYKYYDFTRSDQEFSSHLKNKNRSMQNKDRTITDKELTPIVEQQSEELVVNMDDLMQGMGDFWAGVGQSETVVAFTSGYEEVRDPSQKDVVIQEGEASNVEEKKESIVSQKSERYEFYDNTKKDSIINDRNTATSLKKVVKEVRMSKVKSEISDILKIMEPVTQMIEDNGLDEEKI